MTEIERKAQELVNEVRAERGRQTVTDFHRGNFDTLEALCRAIERHEAFRQEVSDAVTAFNEFGFYIDDRLGRFIIPKPDPLVIEAREILAGMCENQRAAQDWRDGTNDYVPGMALVIAGIKRGLEIREKSDG